MYLFIYYYTYIVIDVQIGVTKWVNPIHFCPSILDPPKMDSNELAHHCKMGQKLQLVPCPTTCSLFHHITGQQDGTCIIRY